MTDFSHATREQVRQIFVTADTLHRQLARISQDTEADEETLEVVARIAADAEDALDKLDQAERHVPAPNGPKKPLPAKAESPFKRA